MRLIGLCGKKLSGKSTLAKLIGGEVLSFATPIKDALVAMGVPRNILEDPDLKDIPHPSLSGRTPRYAMQTLGTEWGRDLMSKDFWSDKAIQKVLDSKSDTVIFDDVRFISEVNVLAILGGFMVYVDRPAAIHFSDPHISEGLNPVNLKIPVIDNTGTPGELLEAFNALYSRRT